MSPANSTSSPVPHLFNSSSKKSGIVANAWQKAAAQSQESFSSVQQSQEQPQKAVFQPMNLGLPSQSVQFPSQKIFKGNQQASEKEKSVAQSINLVQSQPSEHNQPHERMDSDEIELQDSDDDGCIDNDNFGSIESKGNVLLYNENHIPTTQTLSNVDQMSRLEHQNLSRIN